MGQPRQIGARPGFVQAAVLAAKSSCSLAAAVRSQAWRPVTGSTATSPRRACSWADPVKQLARDPYLGAAVRPCRELIDDRHDMLGVHMQEDVTRGSRRPRL